MANTSFLSVYEISYVKQADKVFRDAKAKAIKFCGASNPFIPITKISKGTGNLWSTYDNDSKAEITLE